MTTEEAKKTIITLFNNNLHNKLTVELSHGMLQSIFQAIEKIEPQKEKEGKENGS